MLVSGTVMDIPFPIDVSDSLEDKMDLPYTILFDNGTTVSIPPFSNGQPYSSSSHHFYNNGWRQLPSPALPSSQLSDHIRTQGPIPQGQGEPWSAQWDLLVFLRISCQQAARRLGCSFAKSPFHLGWFMSQGHPHPWPCLTLFPLVPIFLHDHYFWFHGLICQCCQPPLGLPTFPSQGIGRHSSRQGCLAQKLLRRKAWHSEPWYV